MKVCKTCQFVSPNKVKQCPNCGGEDFEPILVPRYDDWEPYLEEKEEVSNE